MRKSHPSRATQDMNTEGTLTSPLIRLRGKLPDQSAQMGILIRIHNLNLQIVSAPVQEK